MDDEEKQKQAALRLLGGQIFEAHHARGIDVAGWQIVARKHPILKIHAREQWEARLGTAHLPDMVFGDSSLELLHKASGICIFFNAFDALCEWKKEALPPVEVPAAAKWKNRSKPSKEIVLNYDYTFTTSYSGSTAVNYDKQHQKVDDVQKSLRLDWIETEEHIDLDTLRARDPILFYDEVVLYEDELADNGVSILTAKVRVMPSCWFLLLRFWLRVDGVLMRLRDTRMYSSFKENNSTYPTVLRERCIKDGKFKDLVAMGVTPDLLADKDGNMICDKLRVCKEHIEKLTVS